MQLPEPILELTLEKPAIIEEIQYEQESPHRSESSRQSERSGNSDPSGESESSGGGKGKLLGLLAVLAGVGLLVWKRKGDETEQTEVDEFGESKYEHGPEPDIGDEQSGGVKRKVAGVLGLVVVTLAVAVLKRRG